MSDGGDEFDRIELGTDQIRALLSELGIKVLAQICEAATADEVLDIAEAVLGKGRLSAKSQFIVQELLGG